MPPSVSAESHVSISSSSSEKLLTNAFKMVQEPEISFFYRLWFSWVDPLIIFFAVYMNVFEPNWMINLFSHLPFDYHLHALMWHLGGSLAAIAILQVFLLRHTEDVWIWKLVQWAVLVCDGFYLYGQLRAMYYHNRLLLLSDWWKEDLLVLMFLLFTATLRISFITGAGATEPKRARLMLS